MSYELPRYGGEPSGPPKQTPVRSARNTDWLETTVGRIRLRKDGVVEIRPWRRTVVTLQVAQATTRTIRELLGERGPAPHLIDYRFVMSESAEARRYHAQPSDMEEIVSRCALLVDTPVSRVLGNVYLGLTKPRQPTRLFSDERAALEWLVDEE